MPNSEADQLGLKEGDQVSVVSHTSWVQTNMSVLKHFTVGNMFTSSSYDPVCCILNN